MSRLISLSRYILLVPVLVTLLGACVLIAVGTFSMVNEVFTLAREGFSDKTVKKATVDFISAVDVFLIATVMYIIAVGLYELFIGPLQLPTWLTFKSFDDLKEQLVSVVIAVLAVLFLSSVVGSTTESLLVVGAASSVMILALTLFLSYKSSKTYKASADKEEDAGDQGRA